MERGRDSLQAEYCLSGPCGQVRYTVIRRSRLTPPWLGCLCLHIGNWEDRSGTEVVQIPISA